MKLNPFNLVKVKNCLLTRFLVELRFIARGLACPGCSGELGLYGLAVPWIRSCWGAAGGLREFGSSPVLRCLCWDSPGGTSPGETADQTGAKLVAHCPSVSVIRAETSPQRCPAGKGTRSSSGRETGAASKESNPHPAQPVLMSTFRLETISVLGTIGTGHGARRMKNTSRRC